MNDVLHDVEYFQAHKLGNRIHDIDLDALDVKIVSQVRSARQRLLDTTLNFNFCRSEYMAA